MEIVDSILDLAEYYVITQSVTRDDENLVVRTEHDPTKPYVLTQPLLANTKRFRKIVFTIESHDQGWSNDSSQNRSLKGTYESSWTWFDVGVVDTVGNLGAEVRMGPSINCNAQVILASLVHTTTWTRNSISSEVRDWFNKLQPEDAIAIVPRARFPGWTNYIQFASIELYCHCL